MSEIAGTGGFDVQKLIVLARAIIADALTSTSADAVRAVDELRARRPLATREDLLRRSSRRYRLQGARAVAYSLPSFVPGIGTGATAVAIPEALRELLKSSTGVVSTVAAVYDRPLQDAEAARIAVLLVLTDVAAGLDVTKRVRPRDVLGPHADLSSRTGAYADVLTLGSQDRQALLHSQDEIVKAWALTVGAPLLSGMLPFGLGPLAAGNFIQLVMKRTIESAARLFAPDQFAVIDVDVDDISDDDIGDDGQA